MLQPYIYVKSSVIIFQLIFAQVQRFRSNFVYLFIFWSLNGQLLQCYLLKMFSLLPLNCFLTFTNNYRAVFLWLHFWNLCSVPLLCLYLYLDYCASLDGLNIGMMIPPLDSCQDSFSCFRAMTFFIDFRISFSMCAKNLAGILIGIVLNLQVSLGEN